MNDNAEACGTPAQDFHSGAYSRMARSMPILAALVTCLLWWRTGAGMAVGFVLGCAVGYLNFVWLKHVVSALADRATRSERKVSGAGVVARFLLRYAIIAVAAYGILRVSKQSLYGMLAGLFLPVAAILCEAGYELYVYVRRGI